MFCVPGDVAAPLDISQLAPPDFIISGLVRPRTARVLVVEDCTLTQHVMVGLLSKMTSNVTQAFDGEQAVDMCQREQFDLILMDLAMPKLNGLEATRHIRSASKNMYVPIVWILLGKVHNLVAFLNFKRPSVSVHFVSRFTVVSHRIPDLLLFTCFTFVRLARIYCWARSRVISPFF